MRYVAVCIVFVFSVMLLASVSAATLQTGFYGQNTQTVRYTSGADIQEMYSYDQVNTYWPVLRNADDCTARQDVLLIVPPGGCTPMVVRSDLLAEQDVPVFCQISALNLNPLINIKRIKSISFGGNTPREVAVAGYHPARAALGPTDRLFNNPLTSNIGYVVLILKKNPNEAELPDFVNVTLSATIEYDSGNAFGVGRSEFLLPEAGQQPGTLAERQVFLNGRYSVQLESADATTATVAIYQGDQRITSMRVQKDTRSNELYLPGSYCQFKLRPVYEGLVAAQSTAVLQVGDDLVSVYKGSTFAEGKCTVSAITNQSAGGSVTFRCSGTRDITLSFAPKSANGTVNEKTYTGANGASIESNFSTALELYNHVKDNYPSEQKSLIGSTTNGSFETTYAEDSLREAYKLAVSLGKMQSAHTIVQMLLTSYPNSPFIKEYMSWGNELAQFEGSSRTVNVNTGTDVFSVTLLSVRNPVKAQQATFTINENPSAQTVSVGGRSEAFSPSSSRYNRGYFVLESVTPDRASIVSYCDDRRQTSQSITLNGVATVCDTPVRLTDIGTEKYAKLRLEAGSGLTTTRTNLSVGVGIEKRAISLTPEKAAERIDELNKTIAQWEGVSKGLGNVVTGLKSACFATAGVLTVKNFLTGLSGEGYARQLVMRQENGWTDWCKNEVARTDSPYSTLNDCYLQNAEAINRDVGVTTQALNEVNEKIGQIEEGKTRTDSGLAGVFGGASVDRSAACTEYAAYLRQTYGSRSVGTQGQTVNQLLANENGCEEGEYTYTQLRELELNLKINAQQNGISGNFFNKSTSQLDELSRSIVANQNFVSSRAQEAAAQAGAPKASFLRTGGQSDVYVDVKPKDTRYAQMFSDVTITHVALFTTNGFDDSTGDRSSFDAGWYVAGLAQEQDGSYRIVQVTRVNNINDMTGTSSVNAEQFATRFNIGRIVARDSVDCVNTYRDPEVRYYETGQYKGLPEIVPLDVDKGWYAATKPTLPAFGGTGGFEASGRVSTFYLCNVGPNGRAQFGEGYGDDICQQVDLNRGQTFESFSCLTDAEMKRYVNLAVQTIQEAAQRYASGQKSITLGKKTYSIGRPAAAVPAVQCQDYMDPRECTLMFNVCDPVICPASRCDLGGTFPVSDVIQTGVVGSALLCLPNIREGIVLPVCLSGIKSGVDSYLSILKSHQLCLEESIQSGRLVGICDEITSVYTCEFFWRQIGPAANALLPKAFELLSGQAAPRGGGEYGLVQSAWQNTEGSINYFTQTYAANSLEAFKVRSIESAGSTMCRAFISTSTPQALKSLVEPDSPPQFHAWFSSIPFSDVTVPATAQYKVFYHIFAGEDTGTSYSVYLKNPPATSYYTTAQTVTVSTGFIPRGRFATETKDFTAPVGYQELCVRINNEEECGFKQVSTDFALNYMRDAFVSEELERTDITSAQECTNGGPNPAALLQPNIQAAAEEAAIPNAYARGVTRICATQNPGLSTNPTRYSEVGYCDDQKIKCWLDTESVKEALTSNNIGLQNSTLQAVTAEQQRVLSQQGVIIGDRAVANTEFQRFEQEIKKMSVAQAATLSQRLMLFSEQLVFNDQRAHALFLQGQIHDRVARILSAPAGTASQQGTQASEITQSSGTTSSGTQTGTTGQTNTNENPEQQGFVGPPAPLEFASSINPGVIFSIPSGVHVDVDAPILMTYNEGQGPYGDVEYRVNLQSQEWYYRGSAFAGWAPVANMGFPYSSFFKSVSADLVGKNEGSGLEYFIEFANAGEYVEGDSRTLHISDFPRGEIRYPDSLQEIGIVKRYNSAQTDRIINIATTTSAGAQIVTTSLSVKGNVISLARLEGTSIGRVQNGVIMINEQLLEGPLGVLTATERADLRKVNGAFIAWGRVYRATPETLQENE